MNSRKKKTGDLTPAWLVPKRRVLYRGMRGIYIGPSMDFQDRYIVKIDPGLHDDPAGSGVVHASLKSLAPLLRLVD